MRIKTRRGDKTKKDDISDKNRAMSRFYMRKMCMRTELKFSAEEIRGEKEKDDDEDKRKKRMRQEEPRR